MKILFVLRKGRASAQTGEGTQTRETAKALADLGHVVTKVFVSPHPFSAQDENGNVISSEERIDYKKMSEYLNE